MRGRSDLAECSACRVGGLLAFSWPDAQQTSDPEIGSVVDALIFHKGLRVGSLYRCRECGSLWHLNGAEQWMTAVPKGREKLIDQWNAGAIHLGHDQSQMLHQIGANAPSFLGIGSEAEDTPCAVMCRSGETIEFAIVTRQAEAPVHDWREYRLATEIVEISESSYAL